MIPDLICGNCGAENYRYHFGWLKLIGGEYISLCSDCAVIWETNPESLVFFLLKL
jgi:hypothetical protein